MRRLTNSPFGVSTAIGVAAAVLGLAVTARSSIVYQDIPDTHIAASGRTGDISSFLDLNADGVSDVQFRVVWSTADITTYQSTVISLALDTSFIARTTYPVTGAEALPSGFSIEPVLAAPPPNNLRQWGGGTTQLQRTYTASDVWHGWWSGPGYLGIRFTLADGDHYGWVSMSAGSSYVDVFSFAYDSAPNAPIAAGAVPAPPTVVIFASMAGLTGLGRRRSRGVCGRTEGQRGLGRAV